MALYITRRRGESFSVTHPDGSEFSVEVVKIGAEVLLAVTAPGHLIVRRDPPNPPGPKPIAAAIRELKRRKAG